MSKKTNRGFNIFGDFKDREGNGIYIVHSSLATAKCVRLYIHNKGRDYENQPELLHCAHMTKTQAKRVVKALIEFIDQE